MAIKIEQGLFTAEFTDHHAILGVPVDAEPKVIRKHYLKLARRLHPDSCATESEADRMRAAEFLSKLVNPAYEKLSDEKHYAEYQLLLKLKGKQTLQQQDTVMLSSEPARKLASEPGSGVDSVYRNALKALAQQQYDQLEETAAITGQISELNLVYLMRKAGEVEPTPGASARASASPAAGGAATGKPAARGKSQPPASNPPQRSAQEKRSVVSSYLWRAQELERKQDFPGAIKELRDALKLEPQNGDIHCRLGVIYLRNNQGTMAKIHFRKALEINPQDARAEQGLKRVDPTAAGDRTTENSTASKPGKSNPGKGGKSDGGGLFGLFGGKKK